MVPHGSQCPIAFYAQIGPTPLGEIPNPASGKPCVGLGVIALRCGQLRHGTSSWPVPSRTRAGNARHGGPACKKRGKRRLPSQHLAEPLSAAAAGSWQRGSSSEPACRPCRPAKSAADQAGGQKNRPAGPVVRRNTSRLLRLPQRAVHEVSSFSSIEKILPVSILILRTRQVRPLVSVNLASYVPASTPVMRSRSS